MGEAETGVAAGFYGTGAISDLQDISVSGGDSSGPRRKEGITQGKRNHR